MTFRGLGTALITPFRDDGSLDEAALERFVDWQIEQGVNFLVPCGTTGENPAMTAALGPPLVGEPGSLAMRRMAFAAGGASNKSRRDRPLALSHPDLKHR